MPMITLTCKIKVLWQILQLQDFPVTQFDNMPFLLRNIIFPYSSLAVVKIWETIYYTQSNIQVFFFPSVFPLPSTTQIAKREAELVSF